MYTLIITFLKILTPPPHCEFYSPIKMLPSSNKIISESVRAFTSDPRSLSGKFLFGFWFNTAILSGAWAESDYFIQLPDPDSLCNTGLCLWHWPNRLLAQMDILLKIQASKH